MATLFVDFENGNDNYGGTSFAVLAQGTNGRISSTTFSSSGASFPNDGSLIGQYLSIFNGSSYLTFNITAWVSATSLTIAQISGGDALANQAVDRQFYVGGRWKSLTNGATAARIQPGDTVRMMGSPAPTSLGQTAVWTSQALQGSKGITGATNTTPISVPCAAHNYSTGDTIVITGVNGNTAANGTWEITVTGPNNFTLDGSSGNGAYTSGGTARLRNNTRVMLSSAVTQNIACTGPGRSNWTPVPGGNVTTFVNVNNKEHYYCDTIALTAGFTTGLAAYYTLPSTLDLSGYQQVSFWALHATGNIGAAGAIDLRLCSDTAGAVPVHTISIPNLTATNRWMPITVDFGAPLGTNINSVALYVNTDNGAQTFYFSNIIACKASNAPDSLTLTSLIGKNTSGETFWGIQSINGRRVMLDCDTIATPSSTTLRGYYGTTETVTTWKRETIKIGPSGASTTALQTIQDSGTDGNPITFSGGWDRTNMSTQSLETWLDGVNGFGFGFSMIAILQFLSFDTVAMVRFSRGFNAQNTAIRNVNTMFAAINNCTDGISLALSNSTIGCVAAVANSGNAYSLLNNNGKLILNGIRCYSNGANGILQSVGGNFPTYKGDFRNNGSGALAIADGFLDGVLSADNNNIFISIGDPSASTITARNTLTTGHNSTLAFSRDTSNVVFFSHDHDQIAGNHKIFMAGALISSATDQRYISSGISWKIQPTSTNRSSSWPVVLSLAKVAVNANNLVTVKAWMRRDNSGLTMRLVCKGGQIAGVANDVVAAVTTTNTWEEQTITFTPTAAGVVEITAEAWGGTTFSGWVDAMTISQA